MGFFKDVHTLTKQGKEMQKNTDVKANLAKGMAGMQAASAMMAQQTTAAMLATTGVATTATVAGVRPTGMQINMAPVVDIDLTVFRNGLTQSVGQPGSGDETRAVRRRSRLVVASRGRRELTRDRRAPTNPC